MEGNLDALLSRDDDSTTLRDRLTQLEALFDRLQVGVLVQGPNAEILVSNQTARTLLGLSEEQLIGATSLDAGWSVVREDGSPFPGSEHPVPAAIRTKRPVQDVVMGVERPALGDRIWLMVNADPYLDSDGNVDHVLCTFTNITERRRTVAELRESEALMRRIFESMPAGFIHFAPDGTIVDVNQEALRVFGMETDAIVGHHVSEFVEWTMYEDGTAMSLEAYPVVQCLETGERQPPLTVGAKHPDGTTQWGVYTAVPLYEPESHEISGAVVAFVDITERKQLEEHLRHVQRVEAIARLAGGVAHHFNNLLTVVNGYAALMLKRLDEADPMYRDAYEVRKAGERAAQLTRQLLAFNRKHIVKRRVVDVNALVADMEPMLSPLFGEVVRFEAQLDANPSTVWADPAQIEDIVLNLAVNARDAMPSGGRFVLSTGNFEVTRPAALAQDLAPGRYVALRALDTGVGIPSDVLPHIFEPFFTTKDVGKGTGLGLSTIYEIVRQSHGRVDVRTEPGRGTEFTVLLPEEVRPREPEVLAATTPARKGRETVLVVEDEATVRAFLRETLLRSGYRVLDAENGRAALELCDHYPGTIDLLVSDITMPEIGGPDLARALVSKRPRCRVLFISGYTGSASVLAETGDLDAAFLEKPFSPETFVERVRLMLDRPI